MSSRAEWITTIIGALTDKNPSQKAEFGVDSGRSEIIQRFKASHKYEGVEPTGHEITFSTNSCTPEKRCTIGLEMQKENRQETLLTYNYFMEKEGKSAGKMEKANVLEFIANPKDIDPKKITCCEKCYFSSKILTLSNTCKCAEIPIELKKSGTAAPLKLHVFGMKTAIEISGQKAFYQNLLTMTLENVKYLLVWNDLQVELLKLTQGTVDLSGGETRTIYTMDDTPIAIQSIKLTGAMLGMKTPQSYHEKQVELIKIDSLYLNPTQKFREMFSTDINKAFLKSYPRSSEFKDVPEFLAIKKRKTKKEEAEKKKEESSLPDIGKYFSDFFSHPALLVAAVVTGICVILLIIKELAFSGQKPKKRVNML